MKPKRARSRPPPDSEKVKQPRNVWPITHENLPNEILTQIFQNLSLKELLQAGNTCQRWKLVISHTEKLWKMANLTGKIVPVSFLNHLCFKYVESETMFVDYYKYTYGDLHTYSKVFFDHLGYLIIFYKQRFSKD